MPRFSASLLFALLWAFLGFPKVAYAQADDCFKEGEPETVVKGCTARLASTAEDGDVYLKRGAAYTDLGRFAEAKADLNRAIAIFSKPGNRRLFQGNRT